MFLDNIDKSFYQPTDDLGIFKTPDYQMYGSDDGNMGFWSQIVTGLVQTGGQIYGVKSQKKTAQRQLTHDTKISEMAEKTKRMELAIQAKQLELLAPSGQKTSTIGRVTSTIKSPIGMITIAGASIGIGVILYLVLKKKKRR